MKLLSPNICFTFYQFQYQKCAIVLLEIYSANHRPISFKNEEFIRIGSYKKKLKSYPEKERELWLKFEHKPFEKIVATPSLSVEQVMALIDYNEVFSLFKKPLPESHAAILEFLENEELIIAQFGQYKISNLGAILFAKNLQNFEKLTRKALRIITYTGNNRVKTSREQVFSKGYAVSFESIMEYIDTQLPRNEEIGQALRTEVQMYPSIAVRELVANSLIHQDFNITGTGPMVEIFCDLAKQALRERIEITNPGIPLIDTLRFIDEPPRSRNEIIASKMRRLNICEERGSGIDKVVFLVEAFGLPAPDFQVTPNHTKAILYAPKEYSEMDSSDRIRACYQHACLCWVSNQKMTNTTLRKRFGIEDKNYPMVSRIIKDTMKKELIKLYDPNNTSNKNTSYVPFWA